MPKLSTFPASMNHFIVFLHIRHTSSYHHQIQWSFILNLQSSFFISDFMCNFFKAWCFLPVYQNGFSVLIRRYKRPYEPKGLSLSSILFQWILINRKYRWEYISNYTLPYSHPNISYENALKITIDLRYPIPNIIFQVSFKFFLVKDALRALKNILSQRHVNYTTSSKVWYITLKIWHCSHNLS